MWLNGHDLLGRLWVRSIKKGEGDWLRWRYEYFWVEKVKDPKKKKENTGGVDEKSDAEDDEDNNFRKQDGKVVNNTVTIDMKLEFVEKVKKLSNESLTKMVQKI